MYQLATEPQHKPGVKRSPPTIAAQPFTRLRRSPETAMLQLQQTLGNRRVRRLVAETRAAALSVQREGEEATSGETPSESPVTLPNIDLTLRDTPGRFSLGRLLHLAPPLIDPLASSDPSPFQVRFLPLDPLTSQVTQSRPPWLEPLPPQQQQASTPSLPSSATLFSHGPFRFRLIFEEPSITLPEQLQEEEARYRAIEQGQPLPGPSEGETRPGATGQGQPSPELDVGRMIKGLVGSFLTTTEPGRAILDGLGRVTGATGAASSPSGPSWHLNLDLLPTPILEGQPPMIYIGVEGRF